MVGEMVQSLYSFTFNALIDIHEYIYSHSNLHSRLPHSSKESYDEGKSVMDFGFFFFFT